MNDNLVKVNGFIEIENTDEHNNLKTQVVNCHEVSR